MIRVLGWPLLVTRRNIARLTLLDKMATKHVLIAYCSLLLPYPYYTKSTPAGAYAYAPLDKMHHQVYFSSFSNTVAGLNIASK